MNVSAALHRLAPAGGRLVGLLGDDYTAELDELDRRLGRGEEPAPVLAMARDLFAAGGKRLRGVAALTVGRAIGMPVDHAIGLAELVELTHGATLLHDDVIDEADTRRGQPAARVRWSNTLSVLGGDFVLLRALERVAELGSAELARAHRAALRELLSAEVAQHLASRTRDWSVETYLDIARGKTGSLFALACAGAALCARELELADTLERFGLELGTAFQVADDLRDLLALDSQKPASLDLATGVPSLPIRLAAAASPALRGELEQRAAAGASATPLDELRAAVVRAGGVASALQIGRDHLAQADGALARLSMRPLLGALDRASEWIAAAFVRCEEATG